MPRVIRERLEQRALQQAAWRAVVRDFAEVTGVAVGFVGASEGAVEVVAPPGAAVLCARLRADPAGCRMCRHFQRGLRERALAAPAVGRCDGGLVEIAVPVRAAGLVVGHLMVIGLEPAAGGPAVVNRARHLLGRAGVAVAGAELAAALAGGTVVPAGRVEAMARLLLVLAERLGSQVAEDRAEADSAWLARACGVVHAEFARPLTLSAVAARMGLSEGHFSRAFHQAAGLRFVEYLARFRAEQARARLLEGERPVSRVAGACGFRSMSQFNRVFRAQFGCSPRDLPRTNGRPG